MFLPPDSKFNLTSSNEKFYIHCSSVLHVYHADLGDFYSQRNWGQVYALFGKGIV